MELCSFKESNIVFDKPTDMSHDQCQSASAFVGQQTDGQPVIITCWKITANELEEFNKTGRIWCTHVGTGIQPHVLHTESPFQ